MFWRRKQREDDLDRELQSHLAAEADEHGDPHVLGNVTKIKEDTRAAWGGVLLEQLAQDLRYAFRNLRRSPGFTLAAVLSLALGIGANTAIFTLIDALLLRWLPVRDPQQLVQIVMYERGTWFTDSFSYPVVRVLSDQTQIFSGLAGFSGATFNTGPSDAVERVPGAWVSGAFFETLGLIPQTGRLIARADDQPGATPVAVISDGYWERKFARDPQIAGKIIQVEGSPVIIAGVSPAGFQGANVGQVADIT